VVFSPRHLQQPPKKKHRRSNISADETPIFSFPRIKSLEFLGGWDFVQIAEALQLPARVSSVFGCFFIFFQVEVSGILQLETGMKRYMNSYIFEKILVTMARTLYC